MSNITSNVTAPVANVTEPIVPSNITSNITEPLAANITDDGNVTISNFQTLGKRCRSFKNE